MQDAERMNVARLLFPALRWHADTGFAHEADTIARALERGVGGFIIFGGSAQRVRELVSELRTESELPLLIGADLERGAGQQFDGATPLPPLAAIGSLDDEGISHAAAQLTAREALALGVNWVYAPVADVDLESANPIVGTRAFSGEPDHVARHVAAWIDGCRDGGALSCAKHFPGHGRTVEDSHAALPIVHASRNELEIDLAPFRAAVAAGVDSMMTAHVVYPALDPDWPATLSARIVTGLLRDELGFDGLVVTDALIMEGALEGAGDEATAAVAAIAAGCDALLYPSAVDTVERALEAAVGKRITPARIAEAIRRIDAAAARVELGGRRAYGRDVDRIWARMLGARAIVPVRGGRRVPEAFDLLTVDDDVGGPYAVPSRSVLGEWLRAAGVDVRETAEPERSGRPLWIAVYSDIRAWKGRPGLSSDALQQIEAALADSPACTVLLFGHPRLAGEIPAPDVIAAWGGETIMQEAMADWIVSRLEG
jgi:beta-glucosidase-like glycosyl hydrolase